MKKKPFVTAYRGTVMLALILGVGMASCVESQGPTVQGLWKSNDTTIRITVKGDQAKGKFAEVGTGAQAMGFKAEDTSFTATVMENYLHGEQTIRYAGPCHPNGRKVAMIGRLAPNGQSLAIHFYSIMMDDNCRDTGEYTLSESLWQRVAGK